MKSIPVQRILVEGLVIVASILAAFAIDAWWDTQQEEEKFEAYYAALLTEATGNMTLMQELTANAERGVEAPRVLREHLRDGWREISADSLAYLFAYSGAIWSLDFLNTSTLDQLVSTGDLGRMPNDPVRDALLRLGRELELASSYMDRNLLEHRWAVSFPWWTQNASLSEVFRAFWPDGPYGEHRFTTDWASLADDLAFDNLLVTRMALGQEQANAYRDVLRALQGLVEVLPSTPG